MRSVDHIALTTSINGKFTAITYQCDKLGTCNAKDIHEAREKLQKRFGFGLIKFTAQMDGLKWQRIVTL